MCANFQLKRTTLTTMTFLAQICLKRKSESGFRINILEMLGAPIFRQNWQLWIFAPKVAQKLILASQFQKSNFWFGINTYIIPCVPIFSQNRQLLTFRPKFKEIANYVQYFGSNILEDAAESWMEAKMSWVEDEMSLVEVDGPGWRWVHGLVIPNLI